MTSSHYICDCLYDGQVIVTLHNRTELARTISTQFIHLLYAMGRSLSLVSHQYLHVQCIGCVYTIDTFLVY